MARRRTEDGIRYIESDSGIWFERDAATGKWWTEYQDGRYELERRSRCPGDTPDTGWYLYGPVGSYFGEWCGRLVLDAADKSAELILSEQSEN